jgi:peroxiredoxin
LPSCRDSEEGYRFSDLLFRGVNGNEDRINLANGESKTLLLVFNSACLYCQQQYPYWKELITNLDPHGWRVLAISSEDDTEKLEALMQEQNIQNVRVGTVAQVEMRRARMLFTPMTIAIDAQGEVKKVWSGLWTKGFDLQF